MRKFVFIALVVLAQACQVFSFLGSSAAAIIIKKLWSINGKSSIRPKTPLYVSSTTPHIKSDSHGEIFYKQPQLRKIAKAYLHRKIFSLNDRLVEKYPSSCKVEMIRDEVVHILKHILCPMTEREALYEYQQLLMKLHSKSSVDEYELFDALLHNRQWCQAGELIVKEFVYLDSMLSTMLQGQEEEPLLSRECMQILKDDLECNLSNVPSYSNDEIVYLMASSYRNRLLGDIVTEEEFKEIEQKLKMKMSNVYISVDRMKNSDLEEHDIHNSIIDYLLKYPVSKF